jgi:hypothetical protein
MEFHEVNEPPSRIIDVKDDLLIDINWCLTGSMLSYICGQWCVQVFLDCMGGGAPWKHVDRLDVDPATHPDGCYELTVTLPANTVKVSKDDCALPCWFVVCITFIDKAKKPGAIAGFVEGPMLQFYNMGE